MIDLEDERYFYHLKALPRKPVVNVNEYGFITDDPYPIVASNYPMDSNGIHLVLFYKNERWYPTTNDKKMAAPGILDKNMGPHDVTRWIYELPKRCMNDSKRCGGSCIASNKQCHKRISSEAPVCNPEKSYECGKSCINKNKICRKYQFAAAA